MKVSGTQCYYPQQNKDKHNVDIPNENNPKKDNQKKEDHKDRNNRQKLFVSLFLNFGIGVNIHRL